MILLDTHVVIWMISSPQRISKAAAEAVADFGARGSLPGISAATVYEMMYAKRHGRIEIHVPEETFLPAIRQWFHSIPVSETIAVRAAALPEPFHGDPMDRMITATAIIEKCTLITRDERIREANLCETLW